MKYGAMSIISALGTKKQLHFAHDAWGYIMDLGNLKLEPLIKISYNDNIFWLYYVIFGIASLIVLYTLTKDYDN